MKTNSVLKSEKLGFPWTTRDPFLFCVHHEDFYPAGNADLGPPATALAGRNIGQDFTIRDGWRMYHGDTVPGFPGHPHAGFETVTVARKGLIDHADSMGGAGRFGDGDVQWMTAGKGVQHSEMFPLLNQDRENTLEMFQIWLNLPRASKKVAPHYKMLWAESIPRLQFEDTQGRSTMIEVIAGRLGEVQAPPPTPDSWAADPQNQVAIWTLQMAPNATWTLPPAAEGIHRTLYFYKGDSVSIAETAVLPYHSAELAPTKAIEIVNGPSESRFLLLQGRPIQEPIAQYGPFVANEQGEIREIIMEYQQTQFGGWPWPRTDQVHARELGRFAKYEDGREELKG